MKVLIHKQIAILLGFRFGLLDDLNLEGKNDTLLVYLLSKSTIEQGGIFRLLHETFKV